MSARDVILQAIRANWIKNDTSPVSEADAILSALDAAGYAVVPKEPTEKMVERILGHGCGGWDGKPIPDLVRKASDKWQAIVTAAKLSETKQKETP